MSTNPRTAILQINTALQEASVGLGIGGELTAIRSNPQQSDHAAFLHPAIEELCRESGISLREINAVAVVNGPGSYTGLRVGLSAAKGICFALNIPLICINTLDWIAFGNQDLQTDMICPMIDARRMEVFTALYDQSLNCIIPPSPMLLDENSFKSQLNNGRIAFVGDGAKKWSEICNHPHANFSSGNQRAEHFNALAFKAYNAAGFTELSIAEPFYLKGFHSTQKVENKD